MPTVEQLRDAADLLDEVAGDLDLKLEAGVGDTRFYVHADKLRTIAIHLEEKAKPTFEVLVEEDQDISDMFIVRVKFGGSQVAVYVGDHYPNGVCVNDNLSSNIGDGTVVWSSK